MLFLGFKIILIFFVLIYIFHTFNNLFYFENKKQKKIKREICNPKNFLIFNSKDFLNFMCIILLGNDLFENNWRSTVEITTDFKASPRGAKVVEEQDGETTFSPTNPSKEQLNAEQTPQNNFWSLAEDIRHLEKQSIVFERR